jgi:parallel beta-helix repeat protein
MRMLIPLVGLLVAVAPMSALAQGSLTPPGSPGPTMKTLAQVEPRTAITNLPYYIGSQGSYYLTGSLNGVAGSNGITIATSGVTVDLNGFALVGSAGAYADGIVVQGARFNIAVMNGTIRAWTGSGLDARNASNGRFTGLQSSYNTVNGIAVGNACIVTGCTVSENTANGIVAYDTSLIEGCAVRKNEAHGIVVSNGCLIRNNTVRLNSNNGITVDNDCVVTGNLCDENGHSTGTGSGIYAVGARNRIEANQLTENNIGLSVEGTNNYLAANTVRKNSPNYSIVRADNLINLLLCELPQSLDWPCKVTLAGSLVAGGVEQDGITVNSDGITIDLNGFSLIGTGGWNGIAETMSFKNIAIRNGTICNWPQWGIKLELSENIQVIGVQASSNGYDGIRVGRGSLVKDCTANSSTYEEGIHVGDGSTVVDCVASLNGETAFNLGSGCTISGCTAYDNGGGGIAVSGHGSLVERCSSSHNGTSGFSVSDGSTITGCNSESNRTGITVHGSRNRIDNNHVSQGEKGILAETTNNLIIRNSVTGCATNYDIVTGNATGILINVTGGGAISNSNPWVNFAF